MPLKSNATYICVYIQSVFLINPNQLVCGELAFNQKHPLRTLFTGHLKVDIRQHPLTHRVKERHNHLVHNAMVLFSSNVILSQLITIILRT